MDASSEVVQVSWETLSVPWWDVVKELNNNSARLATLTGFGLTGFLITAAMGPIKEKALGFVSMMMAAATNPTELVPYLLSKGLSSTDFFVGGLTFIVVSIFVNAYQIIFNLFSFPIALSADREDYNQRIIDLIDAQHAIALRLRGAVSAYLATWTIAIIGDVKLTDFAFVVEACVALIGVLGLVPGASSRISLRRLVLWSTKMTLKQREQTKASSAKGQKSASSAPGGGHEKFSSSRVTRRDETTGGNLTLGLSAMNSHSERVALVSLPPSLPQLAPGDTIEIRGIGTVHARSVAQMKEVLNGRETNWQWCFLDNGCLLEVARSHLTYYCKTDILYQSSVEFEVMAADPQEGGILKLFESRVRQGTAAREPTMFVYSGRSYTVTSTGNFELKRLVPGSAPLNFEVWCDINPSCSGDNVYFKLQSSGSADSEREDMMLGIWTSHMALLFGRPLGHGDISVVRRGKHRATPRRKRGTRVPQIGRHNQLGALPGGLYPA